MDVVGKTIIAASAEMKKVMTQVQRVLSNDFTVLLIGESGVGKEVVARYIHEHSAQATGPFLAVNCGAIPETLFEAEFFGHEKGAFTHAYITHKGFFEQANHGTIFLDEISELPLAMQVKLLRVLENKYVVRLGGEREIPIDVRVIFASNRDLQSLVREGKFRLDLYYRIAVCPIWIPPLRKRIKDIEILASYFLQKNVGDQKILSAEAIKKLNSYDWPGNVRELESCIIRAIIASGGKEVIGIEDIQLDGMQGEIYNAERIALEKALSNSGGSIKQAARLLHVHRNTVYNRIKKAGINLMSFRNSKTIS